MSIYPDAPGHRGVETSIEAADDIAPKLGRLQRLAEATIRASGEQGLTAEELAARLNLDRWSIQPRTTELSRKGIVRDSGRRRRKCHRQAGDRVDREQARMTSAAMIEPAVAAQGLKLHRGATFGEVSNALHCFDNREKRPMPKSGTPGAITYLRIGEPADSACNQRRRGGARNHRERQTDALTPRQVGDLIAAARHAYAIGLPLNRMITIHWESAGVRPLIIARATGRFLDLLGKAIARHGGKTANVWVQESGEGKGGHCHILAHVPADLVPLVIARQRGWLRSITGNDYRKTVSKSAPVGGRLGLETGNPALHASNLAAALSYVLKGADGQAAATYGLARLEPGGRCYGKRCGTSQNIGMKARTTGDLK